MAPVYAQPDLRSTPRHPKTDRRRGKLTPTGSAIAPILRGEGNARALAAQKIGRTLVDHAIEVLRAAKVETAVRKRRPPEKCKDGVNARLNRPVVEWLKIRHHESHAVVRMGLALLMMIVEHVTLSGPHEGRIAAGKDLFIGHQRKPDLAGKWGYVPVGVQAGLAARLDTDVRTVERLIAVLVAGKILRAWQPPLFDEDGKPLPEHLRGDRYAYQMYRLVNGVPPALAKTIRRFVNVPKAERGRERAQLVQAPDVAAEGTDNGCDPTLYASALARMRGGRDPPS